MISSVRSGDESVQADLLLFVFMKPGNWSAPCRGSVAKSDVQPGDMHQARAWHTWILDDARGGAETRRLAT
jgi:hypothetical protein